MKFSVLGLGDTAYPQFCKTAEDVDARLVEAGAQRVIPLRKCDVDYEEDAKAWFGDVLKWLQQQGNETTAVPAATAVSAVRKPAGKNITRAVFWPISTSMTGAPINKPFISNWVPMSRSRMNPAIQSAYCRATGRK